MFICIYISKYISYCKLSSKNYHEFRLTDFALRQFFQHDKVIFKFATASLRRSVCVLKPAGSFCVFGYRLHSHIDINGQHKNGHNKHMPTSCGVYSKSCISLKRKVTNLQPKGYCITNKKYACIYIFICVNCMYINTYMYIYAARLAICNTYLYVWSICVNVVMYPASKHDQPHVLLREVKCQVGLLIRSTQRDFKNTKYQQKWKHQKSWTWIAAHESEIIPQKQHSCCRYRC